MNDNEMNNGLNDEINEGLNNDRTNAYEAPTEETAEDSCFAAPEAAQEMPAAQDSDAAPNAPEAPYFAQQPHGAQEAPYYTPYQNWGAPVYAVPTPNAPKPPKPSKAHKHKEAKGMGAKLIALALCCSLVGGAVGAGGMALFSKNGSDKPVGSRDTTLYEGERETNVVDVSKLDTSKKMTASEVYAANVNSTVGVTTSINTTNFWGYQTTAAASGSGFIISDDGYILTNYHVIEGATSVTVTAYDNTTYDAELVGYDESNDIAVLKIDAKDLTPVVLGDSDNLLVGEDVLAIGNPLGELTFSLTAGTVSALDRKITLSSGVSMDLIQTDCAINSGNSGGALFNLYGEVVGITNAKYSGSGNGTASIDNIGFAIPINTVQGIVQSIIEKGYISKPYIGVSVSDVSEDAQAYGLPKGAAVRAVTEDGPAAKAGLQENDIITEANGKEVTCGDDLIQIVSGLAVGDTMTLKVTRQNESITVTVTVEEKIQQALAQNEDQTQQQEQQQGQPYQYDGQQGQPYQYDGQQGQQSDPFGGQNPFEYFFGN